MAVVDQYIKDLGLFLGALTQLYDPHYIVLGGGLSQQKVLYSQWERVFTPHLFVKNNPPKIFQHSLGDSAGVIGAGLLSLI